MNIDWSEWGAPTIVLALAGIVVAWGRPALIHLLHVLLRLDEGKSRETLFDVLQSHEGKMRMRSYMDALLADRWADVEVAKKVALENRDVLGQVQFTQNAQGLELREIAMGIERLPGLTESLDRMSHSMEDFADKMTHVAEYIARADERERMRERYERGEMPERRRRQSSEPHPHDREDDIT
jgi:hypothetical protein